MKGLLLLGLLAGFSPVSAQVKTVSSYDIHWWGYKLAKTDMSSHDGTIKLKRGEIILKGGKVTAGTFVFDMDSINATDLEGDSQMKLNGHLKSEDFFDTKKYPEAQYKIISVEHKDKDLYKVHGELTLKGKTHHLHFPAKITVSNGKVHLSSDKFSWDRQKFNVAYKSTIKDFIIKNDVDMKLEITAE